MYCPNCATLQSDEQKFCRACGFDLRVVSQAFTSEGNEPDESEATGSQRFQSQRARFEFLGICTIVFALMIGCLIPISLGLFHNWAGIKELTLVLSGLAGLPLFGGIILLLYADTLPKLRVNKEPQRSKPLRRADTTNKLLSVGQAEPVASIAEHTTDLLKTPVGKSPREGV